MLRLRQKCVLTRFLGFVRGELTLSTSQRGELDCVLVSCWLIGFVIQKVPNFWCPFVGFDGRGFEVA